MPRLCLPAPRDPRCWSQALESFIFCPQFWVSREGTLHLATHLPDGAWEVWMPSLSFPEYHKYEAGSGCPSFPRWGWGLGHSLPLLHPYGGN